MAQVDVPQGRNGKHKQIVTQILSDLEQLPAGVALKVPLAALPVIHDAVRNHESGEPERESEDVDGRGQGSAPEAPHGNGEIVAKHTLLALTLQQLRCASREKGYDVAIARHVSAKRRARSPT